GRVGELRDLFPVQVNWKMHPSFLSGNLPSWAVQRKAAPAKAEADQPMSSEKALLEQNKETIIAAYVVFHPDVALDPVGVNVALRHDGVIRWKVRGANTLVVEMPLADVLLLVGEDEVQWIEPPLPFMSEVNDGNRARTGANIVQAAPYNLSGAGVKV